jgi:hypothetical protein
VTRAKKELLLISRLLNQMHTIANAKGIVRCKLKDAVKHGSFPFVEEMIRQSAMPRYRKILKVIGKEWLPNTRLKKRAYIIEGDDENFLLESESVATASEKEESLMELELYSLLSGESNIESASGLARN